MFTGIVLEVASVRKVESSGGGRRLSIRSLIPETQSLALGSSIALNGACMTIVQKTGHDFTFELSPESLAKTNLASVVEGDSVNLEPALTLGAPLGGHLVSGHVDALGQVTEFKAQGDFWIFRVRVQGEARQQIAPFLVPKGSITVDGVSLTVNEVQDGSAHTEFSLTLIPHTLSKTCLKSRKIGDFVNLEADILAKYVNRYAEFKKLR